MGAGSGAGPYVPGTSRLHRLPAQPKIVALLAFVLVVVATPREHVAAFFAYAGLLGAGVAVARLPPLLVLRRTVVEVPFLVFVVVLPFVAQGPQVAVGSLTLSVAGLWAGWNILAKGTLGVVAAILLSATTPSRSLLLGLQRLRLPPLLLEITFFMVRYVEVVTDEMRRMRVARESRGFVPSSLGHLPVLARSAGALFLRAYERGERVHLAMLSRGYSGSLPVLDERGAGVAAWATAAVLPGGALVVAATSWAAR